MHNVSPEEIFFRGIFLLGASDDDYKFIDFLRLRAGGCLRRHPFLFPNKKGRKEIGLEGAYESLLPQVKYTPL